MSKYIEADRLYKDITRSIDYCEDILEIVERQPAADVAEVKHGKWVQDGTGYHAKCSVCGELVYRGWYYSFCPNCGALLRGDEE